MGILVLFSTCVVDGVFGILLTVLNYFAFAFIFYVSGYSMGRINIYHTFMLGHVYALTWFVYWCLSEQFAQPQPLCSFVDAAALLEFRRSGMPALNALLNTSVVMFLLFKQAINEGGLPPVIQAFLLLLSPLWLVSDYLSRNATLEQLLASFLIGTILAIFSVLIFHFVAREFYRALRFIPVAGLLFPNTTPVFPDDPSQMDQDLVMLFSSQPEMTAGSLSRRSYKLSHDDI